MGYTQAELRRLFPVYDLADSAFAAWLVADDEARAAYIAMKELVVHISLKLAFAAFEGRKPEDL
ncbi:hypothetical protein QZM89_07375 [Burkholderia gladioli]|uniref:hypothetical protein n=1 Tax=Burkholderia gladioli TaxID=28095 RepID=UPI0026570EFE|nr:hypothetical protein [Burkholderia gladioli]MDN7495002.1 hypothetical protein [Burkholderia gladioli]